MEVACSQHPLISTTSRSSAFALYLGLVPVTERKFGKSDHDKKKGNSGDGDQEQRRKHSRDIKLKASLKDFVGEPGTPPSGAGNEFGHHSSDQRQAAGNSQTGEEKRQRAGYTEMNEVLPTGCVIDGEQILMAGVDATQADRRVGDDRKNSDNGRTDYQRGLGIFNENDDERCDGYDRCHLQDNGVWKETALYQFALHEQKSNKGTDRSGEAKCDQGNPERTPKRAHQSGYVDYKALGDRARCRKEI